MAVLYEYHSDLLYYHHSIDESPDVKSFSLHAHEQMEILLFISGHGKFFIEGVEYPLHPYDLAIIRSAETHRLILEPGTPYERVAIHFPSNIFDALDPQQHLLRPFLNRPLGRGNLFPSSQFPDARWHSALLNHSYADSKEVHTHVLAMLLTILPELCDAFDQKNNQELPTQGLAAQIVTFVNAHLFEQISIQRISETFYCSPSHVSRIFRQATGSSLWDYILLKRLLAARALLQRGEPSGKACTACGFKDYSSFFRAYKARFGHAPKFDRLPGSSDSLPYTDYALQDLQ